MTEKMFHDAARARDFIVAGKATLTLRSEKTGARFTYRVREAKDGGAHFVSYREGPSYEYMGMIKNGTLLTTARSSVDRADVRFRAFQFAWANLVAGKIGGQLEIWHEGRCGRCGRTLTDPESIERGIGPECVKKVSRYVAEAA